MLRKNQSSLSNKISSLADLMKGTKETFDKDATIRIKNSVEFYDSFFKDLTFQIDFERSVLQKTWVDFFGDIDKIKFLAVDGTSFADSAKNFVTFFGGSIGVLGYLDKEGKRYPSKAYFESIQSLVAYVPIPYSELIITGENSEQIQTEDFEKINLASVHNKIMRLAELYLILKEILKNDHPNYILFDGSISGLQMTLTRSPKGMVLHLKLEDGRVKPEDVYEVHLHPINKFLNQPSELRSKHRKSNDKKWNELKKLMMDKCIKLFDENDKESLYEIYYENDYEIHKSLTPDDYDLLALIALCWIIEICWEKNILLTSISKDSSIRYMTRKYLDVCRHLKVKPYDKISNIPPIMWTDVLYFDAISDEVSEDKPWATIEYDSIFSTLQVHTDETTKKQYITGIQEMFVSPDRLFLKSYAQFYRFSEELMGSDIVTVDRLVYPQDLEFQINTEIILAQGSLHERKKLDILLFRDNKELSDLHKLNLFLLECLCSNKNIEEFGYPSPLFVADKHAKNFLEIIKPIIKTSNTTFFRHPKYWTMRQKRKIIESIRR